jgi:16S rRNA (adenine1518-N6/adenine1519-N6)-dimethyltransferase
MADTKFYHKKSLGQHFLSDPNIARKIANFAEINENDTVWEIGPGKGMLTEQIIRKAQKVICFEIDQELYRELEKRFADKITLVKEDVLKADWDAYLESKRVKIVANLPYQITSPFLFRTVEYADRFSTIVIMIQKEVAERLTAKPKTKEYGVLTLKMNFYFEIKYGFTVKPHLFYPPPSVLSAVIKMQPREDKPVLEDETLFWGIVKSAFKMRRKMLRNNLKNLISAEKMLKLTQITDLTKRAEELSESDFIELYENIRKL